MEAMYQHPHPSTLALWPGHDGTEPPGGCAGGNGAAGSGNLMEAMHLHPNSLEDPDNGKGNDKGPGHNDKGQGPGAKGKGKGPADKGKGVGGSS